MLRTLSVGIPGIRKPNAKDSKTYLRNETFFHSPDTKSIHRFSGSELMETGLLLFADFHTSSAFSSAHVASLSDSGVSLLTDLPCRGAGRDSIYDDENGDDNDSEIKQTNKRMELLVRWH